MPETKYSVEHVKLIIQQSPVDIEMPSDFTPKLHRPPEQYNLTKHFVDGLLLDGCGEKIAIISLSD